MDGVISETEHVHIEAEKQTMLRYGVKISSEELHRYTGATAKFMFENLIKKYDLNTTFEKIFGEKEELLFRLIENDLQPTRGVIELLRRLKRENMKLAIASSSHRRLVRYVLEELNILNLFDSIVSAEDILRSKPDPEIFLKSARNLGVNPGECLVVEDSMLGVAAAKIAGMKVLGYRNPNSGDQDLSKADVVIDDFSDVSLRGLL
jgi:HAD superfamily hydrolase (TIGR01509 family)